MSEKTYITFSEAMRALENGEGVSHARWGSAFVYFRVGNDLHRQASGGGSTIMKFLIPHEFDPRWYIAAPGVYAARKLSAEADLQKHREFMDGLRNK